jgi:hypothetical protein
MMAWRRDPSTGEWEMVDPMTPDPMTQSMTGAEPNPALRDPPPSSLPPRQGEGYSDPSMSTMPLPVQEEPSLDYAASPDNADGYADTDMGTLPFLRPGDEAGYQNYDPDAYIRWEREVEERGNEVRETAVGVFEVDSGGRIVSRPPSGYKVN